jgi:hypothetical protein
MLHMRSLCERSWSERSYPAGTEVLSILPAKLIPLEPRQGATAPWNPA